MRLFSLRKPSAERLTRFLADQRESPFSYAAVGATAGTPPAGYAVDHTRVRLGAGDAAFAAARAALTGWKQFDLGWTEAFPATTPVRVGEVVAVVARSLGVWCRNACRIVAVADGPNRFGFAYGTLRGHVESGEERFLVERDPADGGVWYDVLAFSRPNHVLARLAYPWVRRKQKQFGRDSAAEMRRAVNADGPRASSRAV